ncbi:MAG: hypothetical protein EBZ48_14470 [Proteobacteria bacterium]|nr:hypothetical protein [Pseudomonadota bacterium]
MKGGTIRNPLDERQHGRTIRVQVQEFGVVFALIFTVIGGFQLIRHDRPVVALVLFLSAALFFTVARYAPKVMYPVWKGWMAVGMALGAVVNAVLLSVVWAAMVIPLGILLRVLGKKVMDLSFRAPVTTYWQDRREELASFTLMERQF